MARLKRGLLSATAAHPLACCLLGSLPIIWIYAVQDAYPHITTITLSLCQNLRHAISWLPCDASTLFRRFMLG